MGDEIFDEDGDGDLIIGDGDLVDGEQHPAWKIHEIQLVAKDKAEIAGGFLTYVPWEEEEVNKLESHEDVLV